jgi:RNA polymerase sigma-70 factor (ECF subfamily)
LRGFRGDARFSTWLYQIARREAIDVVGRRKRIMADIDDVALPAPARDAADSALHERDTREQVQAAMAEIDEVHRTAIELRYMAEKPYDEIAAIMGLPEGTVKTYVHRGKLELKRILSRPDWRKRTVERS